jgi:hypothetical protein
LRVAADTLRRADEAEVSATSVVGMIVEADNLQTLEALVQRIAEESGLDARIRSRSGSFSVRFSRRSIPCESRKPSMGLKALVLGLLRG